MPESYLPPLIIDILGRNADFMTKLAEAQVAAERFAREDFRATIGVRDLGDVLGDIAMIRESLRDLTDRPSVINVRDVGDALGDLAAVRGALEYLTSEDFVIHVRTDANLGGAAVAGAAGRGGILGWLLGAGGGGLMGAMRGGNGGAGSAGLFGLGAGLPAFGSILSLLGMGAEHIITTMLGVGGSAVGGLLGGGLLGLGSMGVMGVGMGTDMAGIGQALGDTRAYTQAETQLDQAIAVYGKNSRQAADAQKNLNYVLAGFPKVAQPAIVAASHAAEQFHAMFNAATGPAEKVGAQILTEAMHVGEAFLPTIGKFAAQNMGIIQKDLQPLFSWLQQGLGNSLGGRMHNLLPTTRGQGGLGIFTDLEKIFQSNLPTAMHAVTQGFELFAKTIDTAAQYTGGFIRMIDRFVTRMNSPAGFAKWSHDINVLIGTFRTWMHFFSAIVHTVIDVFGPAMGVGTQIIGTLAGALQSLDRWLSSSGMRKSLHNLFAAHLGEIKAFGGLLRSLLPDLEALVEAFIPMLVIGAQVGTVIAKVATSIVNFLNAVHVGPLLVWGYAILWISRTLFTLGGALVNAGKAAIVFAYGLPGRIAAFGASIAALPAKIATFVASIDMAKVSLIALQTVGVLAVAVGIALLIKHFGVLHGLMIGGAAAVMALTAAFIALDTVPLVALIVGIALAIAGLIAGLIELAQHWSTVWHGIQVVAGKVISWIIGTGVKRLVDAFLQMAVDITGAAADAFGWIPGLGGKLKRAHAAVLGFKNEVDGTLSQWANDTSHWGQQAPKNLADGIRAQAHVPVTAVHELVHDANQQFVTLTSAAFTDGANAGNAFAAGILSTAAAVGDSASQIAGIAQTAIHTHLAISSPSRVMMELGAFTGQGFALGLLSQMANVQASATLMAHAALSGTRSAVLPEVGAAGASSAAGVQPIVVNYTINVTGNGDQQIKQLVTQAVERQNSQLVQTLNAYRR